MTKRQTEAVQHSSKEAVWRTPSKLFAALDAEFQFVLDAAADRTNSLCPHYFGLDHKDPLLRNALQVDWVQEIGGLYQLAGILSRCAIFVNPPFSRELAAAYRSGLIRDGITTVSHPIDLALAEGYSIASWVEKAWLESQKGATVVGVIPYSPQTTWWRRFVEGHDPLEGRLANFHAAREVRKIPHRVSFLRPDGSEADNAGNNTAIVIWKAKHGLIAPWVPAGSYWDYSDYTVPAEPGLIAAERAEP